MFERLFPLRILAGFCCYLSLVLAPSLLHASDTRRPNIIYILADDLGYGDLSCYGQKKFTTPNLDRLAAQGMRFTQHYAGSTVCAPSRCALMSGLDMGHAQIRGNVGVRVRLRGSLEPGTKLIPTYLKEAGYATGIFGKWGLGEAGSTSTPTMFFDEFFGYINQSLAHNYYPEFLWHNDEKVMLNGKAYSHTLIMQAAKDFIRKHADGPFFCYIPLTLPHAAMQALPELHDKYRKLYPQFEDRIGKYNPGNTRVKNPIAAFPAMVEELDTGVGDIMALLKELGIDRNTVVMFSSDNGPHGEGGHDPVFWDSNGPLRGIKRDLYEGGIRVPFIVRWPGHVQPGSTSKLISAFWDMLPTMCELAGEPVPGGLDGISMVPELTGLPQRKHDYLYWEFTEHGGAQAIREGDWKAVRLQVLNNPTAPIELYNLANDLGEQHNLASEHPDITCLLWNLFLEARTESDVFTLFSEGN